MNEKNEGGIPAFKHPNLNSLRSFTHREALCDSLVKKSLQEGYMTEEELLIGRWVSSFLDENEAETEEEDFEKKHKLWLSKLPEACEETSKVFNITKEKAEELFKKSLDIRARNL